MTIQPRQTIDQQIEDSWGIHPVDSTIRQCCGGIGSHTQECTATWRDYSDQLTAEQIAMLEAREAEPRKAWESDADAGRKAMARQAKAMAHTNHLAIKYANVPAPSDAVSWEPWEEYGGDAARWFGGSTWRIPVEQGDYSVNIVAKAGVPDIELEIRGIQYPDGRAERWVYIESVPDELPLASARMLAASLADAVAEIERHNRQSDVPVFSHEVIR